jgi:polysaccharide export outer membrane protein
MPTFIPSGPATPAASLLSVPPPDPVLLPGDLLRITVFRQPDLDLEARIPVDGLIGYPLIGPVQAAGKTPAALQESIRALLDKDYLRNPSVTVTVREYVKRKVYIVGGVTRPSAYDISPDARLTLLQLVAAAGGFTDRAYKEFVQVIRRRGPVEREVIRLSLVEVEGRIAQGRAEADLELWPDDLVVIPAAVRVVYVLGAVHKPGPVDVPNDARVTVSMALSTAGSYTKFASKSRAQVLRHSPTGEVTRIPVNIDAILDGRLELDIELQPGDVLFVPERGIF